MSRRPTALHRVLRFVWKITRIFLIALSAAVAPIPPPPPPRPETVHLVAPSQKAQVDEDA
jgi:hypothetical protein